MAALDVLIRQLQGRLRTGTGNPNGVVTAGGAGATLWVKESGTGNTGWVAK
jgi:Na+/alanine symporter